MLETFAKKLFFGILSLGLFTSPISAPTINSKYKFLQEFLLSPDYKKCTSKSNKVKYLADSAKYGEEYWQSFEETDSIRTGDCNDKSPRLCHELNKFYSGFFLRMGYKHLDNPKSAHFWIGHEEDENLIIDPNYKRIAGLDTSYFVAVLYKDTLPSKLYYEKKLDGYKKKAREFRRRTGVRLPIKEPSRK